VKKIILFLLMFNGLLQAQDTIRFRNGDVKAVKVNEVGLTEVKYNRSDNLEGPMYVTPKDEILYIRYSNGEKDVFSVSPRTEPEKPVEATRHEEPRYTSQEGKIVIKGKELIYQARPLGEIRLKSMIANYPDMQRRSLLLREFEVMRGFKKKQYLYNILGLGLGLGLPYAGLIATSVSSTPGPALVGVFLGVGCAVTGTIFSKMEKKKRIDQKIRIARIYNGEL
jgi:hypothetical protein